METNLRFNEQHFTNCCRTCLESLSGNNIHDVFDQEAVNLAEILNSCLSIRVCANEELLPKSICDNCYKCLINFNNFKSKALTVDEKLQLYLKTLSEITSQDINNKVCNVKSEEQDVFDNDSFTQEIVVDIPNYKYEATDVNVEDTFTDSQMKFEFECGICNSFFYNEIKLANHAKKHKNKKECCSCKKNYKSKAKYLQHILIHQQLKLPEDEVVKSFKCNECDAAYSKMHSLSAHMKKHRDNKILTCTICSKTFKKSYHLNRHKTIHMNILQPNFNDSVPLSNVKNELINTTLDQVRNNVGSIDTQVYQCKLCHAAFRKANSLSAHMKIHKDGSKTLTCSVCSKTFKKSYHLNRHELIHVKNFRCTFCPKTFIERSEWREHVKRHDEYAPIPCPICTKLLSHQDSLNRHMKVHTRERGCLCPHCGKTFENFSNLRQHIKRHLGQKDFSCRLCPEKFISRGELKHHMVVHTEERAFSCNQCGLKFTRKGSLKMHKLKHLDVRPFKCDSCPMGFPTKYMLQRHTRIHTGEKPFKCDLCDRTFGQSGELLKHRRTHLGEKIHRCNECNESFRYKVELRKHISEHYVTDKSKDITDDNISSLITS